MLTAEGDSEAHALCCSVLRVSDMLLDPAAGKNVEALLALLCGLAEVPAAHLPRTPVRDGFCTPAPVIPDACTFISHGQAPAAARRQERQEEAAVPRPFSPASLAS